MANYETQRFGDGQYVLVDFTLSESESVRARLVSKVKKDNPNTDVRGYIFVLANRPVFGVYKHIGY